MPFTVNNVVIPNFAPTSTSGSLFNCIWKLTRAMKKAGWNTVASTDGTTKTVSGDQALDAWNGTAVIANTGATSTITIGAIVNSYRATVYGLSGITSADKGRFLKITGSGNAGNNHWHRIVEIVSSSSVKIDCTNSAFTPVAETASLTWTIVDPSQEIYSTIAAGVNSAASWILMRGPSVMKIPITSNPTSGPTGMPFTVGENVIQASTGAEGEFLGVVFDGVSAGYMVVRPRIKGSGANPFGWATGNVVYGASSGATLTQVGTAGEFTNEIVFWKQGSSNMANGSIFLCSNDLVGEASGLSSLTGATGCTAVVAPGGGGTGNTFPTLAFVVHGSGSSGNHASWDLIASARNTGHSQIMCVDTIEEPGYSADGSFWMYFYNAAQTTRTAGTGFGFQILDGTEAGELHPWVTYHRRSVNVYTNNRTTAGTSDSVATSATDGLHFSPTITWLNTNFGAHWQGWRLRGQTNGNQFQDFECIVTTAMQTNAGTSVLALNTTSTMVVASALAAVTKVRMPVQIASVQANRKMIKGTVRWAYMVQNTGTGSWGNMYDNRKHVQVSSEAGYALLIGPWNSSTTPMPRDT